jgi:hypothetical protein
MVTMIRPSGRQTLIPTPPSPSAIVSWSTRAAAGELRLRVHRADGAVSTWLPYVTFTADARRSWSGQDDVARIAVDVVQSDASPIVAIEVRLDADGRPDAEGQADATGVPADVSIQALTVSVPIHVRQAREPAVHVLASSGVKHVVLDVPGISQYDSAYPNERGWCSPASLAMLLEYWGLPQALPDVARAVYDDVYGGTGNWTFNTAYASSLGVCAAVVHLEGLDHAGLFLAAGIPLALSFAWRDRNELPGAALESSNGHLAVLRGFSANGDPHVNDPAQAEVPTIYPRAALDRLWRAHGGIAYALVPAERADELLRLANA